VADALRAAVTFVTASPSRILFVTRYHITRFTGGAELQCWYLATEFARRGWDVHYASEMEQAFASAPGNVTLHNVSSRASFQKLLRDLRPDVIYNRVLNEYTRYSVEDADPKMLTVWAVASDSDTGAWKLLKQTAQLYPFSQFLRRAPRLMLNRFRDFHAALKANIILTQHEGQRAELKKRGKASVVLRNSFPFVPETEIQNHDGKPVIAWVGSLKHWKRPELFIELARRCQGVDAIFEMAGEIYEADYENIIADAQKSLTNFRYLGKVPADKIDKVFTASHLHVKTSLPLEGFPNTFVQAWLRGVPVVSLNIDPDNLIQNQKLGVVVKSLDELERAVRDLIANPEKRKEIGRHARDFAMKEFDLKKNADKLEELIREKSH
jgi:glycosyltransferase involved in cell wall biosynthesis